MRPNIVRNFEKVLSRYSYKINARELEFFTNQLDNWGFSFGLKRYKNKLIPVIESKGFVNDVKSNFATKHNVSLKLRPYMTI